MTPDRAEVCPGLWPRPLVATVAVSQGTAAPLCSVDSSPGLALVAQVPQQWTGGDLNPRLSEPMLTSLTALREPGLAHSCPLLAAGLLQS